MERVKRPAQPFSRTGHLTLHNPEPWWCPMRSNESRHLSPDASAERTGEQRAVRLGRALPNGRGADNVFLRRDELELLQRWLRELRH